MTAVRRYDTVKRILDMAGAAALLAGTFPAQAVVGVVVALGLGRPVFFRQRRPGRNGELFTLVKFRTMCEIDERRGLVADADRLTGLGRLLRSTSLDELPTLWNVLKGDMSFVGPRPLLPEYLPLYSGEQARRHEVRPGMTGLAQVAGRNAVEWEERLGLDVEYVRSRSFFLDGKVVWRTVRLVLAREGISAAGSATAEPFQGSLYRRATR
jgi:lipopolysaccharide/colanic/teichoic acid biosynthesis glycosyltransferase